MSERYSKRVELLVYGYVRDIEKECEFLNIPKEIPNLVYLYQKLCDEWDIKNSHPDLTIFGNLSTIRLEMNDRTRTEMTAFGAQKVTEGIFKWRLKIISLKLGRFDASPYIGIIEDTDDNLKKYKTSGAWQQVGYQLCAGNSRLWWCGYGDKGANAERGYNCYWNKNGDILEMILDLENDTLRFILNDKDCGVAFRNIKKTQYRLALTCLHLQLGSSFKFLD